MATSIAVTNLFHAKIDGFGINKRDVEFAYCVIMQSKILKNVFKMIFKPPLNRIDNGKGDRPLGLYICD